MLAEISSARWPETLLNDTTPDLVVTGTSYQSKQGLLTPEQQLIAECRHRGIKTISILDYWGFYPQRFSRNHDENFDLLPDFICALDGRCKEDLIRHGVPSDKIVITHNPFFDSVVESRSRYCQTVSTDTNRHILFCSQPLAEKGWKHHWGFDQFDVFELLHAATLNETARQKAPIEVWVHPKENLESWHKKYQGTGVVISRRRSQPLPTTCTVLATCYSTTIFEALHVGIPCLTILPNKGCPVELITETYGLTQFIEDKPAIQAALLMIASQQYSRMRAELRTELEEKALFFSSGNATQKVVHLIEQCI